MMAKDRLGNRRYWPRVLRGEINPPYAKLTAEKVREIRTFLGKGMRQKDIAVLMGVSPPIISQIAHKHIWTWVK
jgi:hypothetical protein